MLTRRHVLAAGGIAAGALAAAGVLWTRGQPAVIPSASPRFPNVVLRTHEGKAVRFYDDLLRGKVVAINMMYARCEGICPRMTTNLLKVQELLGDRLGRDVHMYSVTLQPAHDSPQVLSEYVNRHPVRPRWPFLTGSPEDIEALRWALGFYDLDPEVDRDKSQHTGMVRIGNEPLDRWAMAPALSKPELIAASILRIVV